MKYYMLMMSFLAFSVMACNRHDMENDSHEGHEEIKFRYTVYTNDYELFAEADPFVAGEPANILGHFSVLANFKPVESGKITAILSVKGREIVQTLDKPTRKGIYSIDLKPETPGKGYLKFILFNEYGHSEIIVPDITVYASHGEVSEAAESELVIKTNSAVFTKEQSWKVEFATDSVQAGPFGQVIKTTALVESARESEMTVNARASGTISFLSGNILPGYEVGPGQALFTISGSDLAENNFSVKYTEAANNYEKARLDYERAKELAKDKIVSEKDLIVARNTYENSKAVYDNLSQNFSISGQTVKSPISGYIRNLFVKNGDHVEAGQAILTVSQNKNLVLKAEVSQRYAPLLGAIQTATIRPMHEEQAFTLEQLNGKVLSYGKSAAPENYLIPVNLQIENNGVFTPGNFVELFLVTMSHEAALTVPNSSLIEEQGNFFLYIQVTPELFEKREVFPGRSDGLRTEIIRGLDGTERIITRGAMMVKLAQATGTLDAHSGHVH